MTCSVLCLFSSTRNGQATNILYLFTYEIDGHPGRAVPEYGQYQTERGKGGLKIQVLPDFLCEYPQTAIAVKGPTATEQSSYSYRTKFLQLLNKVEEDHYLTSILVNLVPQHSALPYSMHCLSASSAASPSANNYQNEK